MPWLSPLHSPTDSPHNGETSSAPGPIAPSVTYIPPLIDGACGTIANPQRLVIDQLRNDISTIIRLLPSLVRGAAAGQWRSLSRMDIAKMIQHAGLALFDIYILAWSVPLWLCLPGVLFAAWFGCCMAVVMGMSRIMNGRGAKESTVRSSSPAEGWMMGPDADDERWFFIAGMGESSRSLTQTTLPTLSKIFNRSITVVHKPTYGLPFDLLTHLLHRQLHGIFPCACTRGLYTQIRTALLDRKTSRTVIMAHNTGATCASHILRQLHADIPAESIARLEVYTFGAAARDFVVPLGGKSAATLFTEVAKKIAPGQQQHQLHVAGVDEHRGPHIEHYAFAGDPFARMGVLRGVREGLEGRFCGGVFVLDYPETGRARSSRLLMSMDDYMSCLFPQQSTSTDATGSILECVVNIDRDVAEKREFAAMASHTASTRTEQSKRLSWTGLGATVNGMNGNMDGVAGLEMARKGCKDCDGHKGREVKTELGNDSLDSVDNLEDQGGDLSEELVLLTIPEGGLGGGLGGRVEQVGDALQLGAQGVEERGLDLNGGVNINGGDGLVSLKFMWLANSGVKGKPR
ncbi:hypothetical protein VMCG_03235 [Cytospora schulzeri]|uniref:Uncharacterized protein n=1 Tax=Cytospora schulzeri TaxID=448051 RepID=A0A423WY75_9PEZI|nr:hypothetical protein VMCG_03235 [Valsa malicola]